MSSAPPQPGRRQSLLRADPARSKPAIVSRQTAAARYNYGSWPGRARPTSARLNAESGGWTGPGSGAVTRARSNREVNIPE